MMRKYKLVLFTLILLGIALLLVVFWQHHDIAVLRPTGTISQQELHLIVLTSLLSLIVVVPVFSFMFFVAWKYRAGNKKAEYKPDWDHNRWAEAIWWLVPFALISVLAVITWQSSHTLDPFRIIRSQQKPLTIQVIALQWKWLFIYPEQHVASVNFVQFPKDRPVTFDITSDAPMNSFWIPKLGGQIYAMAGMKTQLNLQATAIGSYSGVSANISGEGFAGMKFTARSSSQADFDSWIAGIKKSPNVLNAAEYTRLSIPSANAAVATYVSSDSSLYDRVIMKYTMPGMEQDIPHATTNHSHDE